MSLFQRFEYLALLASRTLAVILIAGSMNRCNAQEPDSNLFVEVASIFARHCLVCHNEERAEGGYSMANVGKLFVPGDSGLLPIDSKGDDNASELVRRLTSPDKDVRMPADAKPLDAASIGLVRNWIRAKSPVHVARDRPLPLLSSALSLSGPLMAAYPKPMPIRAIALSKDGKRVFTNGYREVLVWDVTGKLIDRIPATGRFVAKIEYVSTSNRLYIASGDPGESGVVESIHMSDGKHVPNSRVQHLQSTDICGDMSIHASTSRLAVGLADGRLIVLDANSNRRHFEEAPHSTAINSVDWSQDGEVIYTGSRDRTAKSHSALDGNVLSSFANHERTVSSVRIVNDGLVTYEETGRMQLFPLDKSTSSRASVDGLPPKIVSVVAVGERLFVPDNDRIRQFEVTKETVTESKEGDEKGKETTKTKFRMRELATLENRRSVRAEVVLSLAVSREQPIMLAAGLSDGEVLLWTDFSKPPIGFVAKP